MDKKIIIVMLIGLLMVGSVYAEGNNAQTFWGNFRKYVNFGLFSVTDITSNYKYAGSHGNAVIQITDMWDANLDNYANNNGIFYKYAKQKIICRGDTLYIYRTFSTEELKRSDFWDYFYNANCDSFGCKNYQKAVSGGSNPIVYTLRDNPGKIYNVVYVCFDSTMMTGKWDAYGWAFWDYGKVVNEMPTTTTTTIKPKCIDSDGMDINTKSYVTYDGVKYWDDCKNDKILEEYVCYGDNKQIREYECPGICDNGKCIIRDDCIDSDGMDENTYGYVKDYVNNNGKQSVGTYYDSCSKDNKAVYEYICEDRKYKSIRMECDGGICEFDMQKGGRCVSTTTSTTTSNTTTTTLNNEIVKKSWWERFIEWIKNLFS